MYREANPPRDGTLHLPKDRAGDVIHPFVLRWGMSQLETRCLACSKWPEVWC